MVLVDTPVWSLALRRRSVDLSEAERRLTQALYRLIQQHRVCLLGAIRQEILSGIRQETQFQRIRDFLRDFPNFDLDSAHYEDAAQLSNTCRRAGIATSAVDMLICSVSLRSAWEIFSTDRDFDQYKRVASIRLLQA